MDIQSDHRDVFTASEEGETGQTACHGQQSPVTCVCVTDEFRSMMAERCGWVPAERFSTDRCLDTRPPGKRPPMAWRWSAEGFFGFVRGSRRGGRAELETAFLAFWTRKKNRHDFIKTPNDKQPNTTPMENTDPNTLPNIKGLIHREMTLCHNCSKLSSSKKL